MAKIDIQNLLSEVSAESPCGEDLSYDQSYLALERMVQTRPTGGVLGKEEVAEEPNWREVGEKSCELLKRSKDLRIAMYLTLALLKQEGISGLRDGLLLLRELLERFWDKLYPQLDQDDNNDPLERINVVQSLSPTTFTVQDPMKFRQRILAVPLCNSQRLGKFSARDIQVVRGQITVSDQEAAEAPPISKIDAAFKDTPQEQLTLTWQAIKQSLEHTAAISRVFSERSGAGQAPDLSMLDKLLNGIAGFLQGYIDAPEAAAAGQAAGAGQAVASGGAGAAHSMQEIRSREDVIVVLKKICDYFARNEPSSPVPLLLRRAQRLISKSFLEVIADVCPDAMNQVEIIGGVSSRGESGYEARQAAE